MKFAITLILLLTTQVLVAQCEMTLNFNNPSDIPTDCEVAWEENGVRMQVEAVPPSTCAQSGCDFTNSNSTLLLAPGRLVIDLSSFNGKTHYIRVGATGTPPLVRLYKGNTLLLVGTNLSSFSTVLNFPDSLAADRLTIDGCQTSLRNILILYNCPEGLPPGDNCLTFEEAIPNPDYTGQNGQIAYTEADVPIYKMPLYDAQSNPQADGQFLIEPSSTFGVGSGDIFWCSFTNALFDFNALGESVNQLSFDLIEGSNPNSNLQVNGEQLFIGDLRNAPSTIAAGVALSVETPLGNSPATRITLEGRIRTLMVGGEEFFMDNVCLTTGAILSDCFDFSPIVPDPNVRTALDAANGYAPGDSLFSQNRIGIFLEEMTTFNQLGFFQGVYINTNDEINLEGAGFRFDFSDYPEVVKEFSFEASGLFNISINGSTQTAFEPDGTLLSSNNLPAGVVIDVEDIAPFYNRITVSGIDIEQFIVAGANFLVRNICYESEPLVNLFNCPNFYALSNGAGATYGSANGDAPGDQLPNIDPQVSMTLNEYEVVTPPANFLTFGNLNITDFAPYPAILDSICLDLDFSQVPEQVTEVSVDLFDGSRIFIGANGSTQVYAFQLSELISAQNQDFSWEVEPIVVNGFQAYHLTMRGIFDSFQLCGINTPFDNLCYTTSTTCVIGNLTMEQLPCGPNNEIFIELDFDHANTQDTFVLTANDSLIGSFPYSELPLVVGPLPFPNPQAYFFEVSDHIEMGCSNTFGIDVTCATPTCSISNVVAEPTDCNDNGEYEVVLDFDHSATGALGFMVIGGGNFYGSFSYADLPITLGPFQANGSSMEFNILDIATPSCIGFTELDAVNCEECEIFNLEVSNQPCTPNGIFYVDLSFEHIATSDSFQVIGNGNNYDWFGYDELPITLGPLSGDGQTVYEFLVRDADNPDCQADITLGSVDCNLPCRIESLETIPGDCTSDSTYNLVINFDVFNPTSDSFQVSDNQGNIIGIYAINDLAITIPDFKKQGNIYDYVEICILGGNGNCCIAQDILSPNCSTDCEISNLVATPLPCSSDSNGLFNVLIDFTVLNPSDSFAVYSNNNVFHGYFSYSDIPVEIGPFVGNGTNVYEILVEDLSNNCSAVTTVNAPDCGFRCEIRNLAAIPRDCVDDSTYLLEIYFEVTAETDDQFDVFDLSGNILGTFLIRDLPITLNNFRTSGSSVDYIKVCVNDNSSCCADIRFTAPDCTGSNCRIYDVIAEAHPCDDNGNFLVDLDFQHENTSDSFQVFGNGNFYGTFGYDQLFLTLGPLSGDGMTAYEFIVKDLENPDCQGVYGLDTIDCTPTNCAITSLDMYTQGCNPDGSFNLVIDFIPQNPVSTTFKVTNSVGNIGTYNYADLPVTIRLVSIVPDPIIEIFVCDSDDPNCCASNEIQVPSCNSCEIDDVIAEAHPCDSNGNFLVDLDFQYSNTSDSFQVFGNGNFYGTFAYDQLFITLGPLPGDGLTPYEFVIRDLENPDCSGVFELGIIDCDSTTNCELSNLDAYAIDCNPDGTYSIAIDFDYQNTTAATFNVLSGGNTIGTYNYSDLPLFITSFTGSGEPVESITVCDVENPNCCISGEFDALFCDSCRIYDLVATPTPCNGDDEFFIDLDFEYTDPGVIGFQVLGNGNNYGTFSYSDLPIRLGPFDESDPDVLEFLVFDIINLNCTDATEVDAPECFSDCIDFETLAQQTFSSNDYTQGDTLFTIAGVPVSIDSIRYSNFSAGMDKVQIFESSAGTPPSQVLIPENSSVVFDFRGLANPVSRLELDFFGNLSGDLNLSINGSGIQIFNDFDLLSSPVIPGVELTVTFDDASKSSGQLLFEGPIETFLIGGQQLSIDNLCFGNRPSILSECLQFSTLPCCVSLCAPQYAIGDVLSVENDVPLRFRGGCIIISEIQNPGPNTFNAQQGTYLRISGELEFDFTEVNDLPNQISFDFATPDAADIEISVNNAAFQLVQLQDTSYEISPGVKLTVSLIPGFQDEGVITLEGPVERFFLRGSRLSVDNVCFEVQSNFVDVWPGDINTDNIANHIDLLHLGIAYGSRGDARSFINTDWVGQAADDWSNYFADQEVNFKHADANGDGIIDINDRTPITENYGSTHGPIAQFIEIPGDSEDPPLRIALEEAAPLQSGDSFYAPITLGSIDTPLDEIYGLAFTIRFNPRQIDPSSVRFELIDDSWLGTNGDDLIHIDRTFADEGKIEVALTRINQEDQGGYGPIAGFIGIIDNIGGKADVEVELDEVRAINSDEIIIPLFTPVTKVQITTHVGPIDINSQLKVYPNPATDLLHIHNISPLDMQSIRVYNVIGQRMLDMEQPEAFETLDIGRLSAGTYVVEIQLTGQIIRKKIEVVNR